MDINYQIAFEIAKEKYKNFYNKRVEKRTNLKNISMSYWDEFSFIVSAISIHGDKYDYSKIVYKNSCTKLTIRCFIYGEFDTTPYNHISKKVGHWKEGAKRMALSNLKSREDVIKNFYKKRDMSFIDLSKFKYEGIDKKSIFIDKDYGEFTMSPGDFSRGRNHKQRGIEKHAERRRYSNEEWLKLAKEKLGEDFNNYEFPDLDYKGAHRKIKVIDKRWAGDGYDGSFMITPNRFLIGVGHPSNRDWKGKMVKKPYDIEHFLYYIKISSKCGNKVLFKIGVTSKGKNIERFKEQILQMPYECEIEVINFLKGGLKDIFKIESYFKYNDIFNYCRYKGERFDGYTECFTEDIVKNHETEWYNKTKNLNAENKEEITKMLKNFQNTKKQTN